MKKKKIWDKVAKGLKTNDKGEAAWDGKVVRTSKGVCSVPSAFGVPIS